MMIRDGEEVTNPYDENTNLSNNRTNRNVHTPNPTLSLYLLKKKKKLLRRRWRPKAQTIYPLVPLFLKDMGWDIGERSQGNYKKGP